MTLPPSWKVKREIRRIREKIVLRTSNYYEPLRRAVQGIWLAKKAKPSHGSIALGNKVAVFIIFQRKKVARSLFLTCDHLIAQGYSPFIISNAPLSAADRIALLAKSALLLERPNFGYDFGAYQDGIRLLGKMSCNLDRLILMNDSTWFPLRSDDTTLARMEAAEADMIGHIFKIEDDDDREHDHVESHLLMFSKRALTHPAFAEFWRNYKMTSNRANTIEYGEKGVTALMKKTSMSFAGLLSRDRIIDLLAALDNAQLADTIEQLVLHVDKTKGPATKLLAQQPRDNSWRQAVLDMCRELLNGRQHLVSTTFVEPAMRLGGMGFVKKALDKRHHLARVKVLEAIAVGRIPPMHDDVANEISHMVEHWVEPIDWRRMPQAGK